MPEQEFDLFEITTGLSAELGAGAAEIVGAEALDADLFGGLFDHRPHRPITQPPSDFLPALADRPQQPAFLDPGRGHPGVDALLDPDGHGHRSDPSSLPHQVSQYPAALAQLDGLDLKRGQLLPTEGAADQQSQGDVVAFAAQGRAVGNGQELPCLLPSEPVPQPGSLLSNVGDVGLGVAASLSSQHPVQPGFLHELAGGREPDINGGRRQTIH